MLGDSRKMRELIGRLDLLLEQSQQVIAGSVQGQFGAAASPSAQLALGSIAPCAPAPLPDDDGDHPSDPGAGGR
jgi:hypothetical protein